LRKTKGLGKICPVHPTLKPLILPLASSPTLPFSSLLFASVGAHARRLPDHASHDEVGHRGHVNIVLDFIHVNKKTHHDEVGHCGHVNKKTHHDKGVHRGHVNKKTHHDEVGRCRKKSILNEM
jgi:hypothetical protein